MTLFTLPVRSTAPLYPVRGSSLLLTIIVCLLIRLKYPDP